jgi:hypothetical protein
LRIGSDGSGEAGVKEVELVGFQTCLFTDKANPGAKIKGVNIQEFIKLGVELFSEKRLNHGSGAPF